MFLSFVVLCVLLSGLCPSAKRAVAAEPRSLATELDPLLARLTGEHAAFSVTAEVTAPIDGRPQRIDAQFVRYDDQQFDLVLRHDEYAMEIQRRADSTALVLPLHKTVYVGSGDVDPTDHLSPQDAANRLVSSGSVASMYLPMIQPQNKAALAVFMTQLLKLRYGPADDQWRGENDCSLQFMDNGREIVFADGSMHVHLRIGECARRAPGDGMAGNEASRIGSSGNRASTGPWVASHVGDHLAVTHADLAGSARRSVPHGELRWVGGQRLALLSGTPQQIGKAHGELLREQATRCIDSVLYAFGTVQTIRTGRWFRLALDDAYQRLAPYIPEDHKTETRALASSLAMDERLIETINVFPEMFHCSGFAVFGKATKDGKLYHGRVLDYMTTIGLQDAATTFVVAVDGKIPFANVGYAGFIGSVTGMNVRDLARRDGRRRGRGVGRSADGHVDEAGAGGVHDARRSETALANQPADLRVLLRVCRRQDKRGSGCGRRPRIDRIHRAWAV